MFTAVSDCSKASNPGRGNTVDRLKRLLALGVDPDGADVDGRRASHVASGKGNYELAEVIALCRPDLRANAGSLGQPKYWALNAMKEDKDANGKSVCRQIFDLWVSFGKNYWPFFSIRKYRDFQ